MSFDQNYQAVSSNKNQTPHIVQIPHLTTVSSTSQPASSSCHDLNLHLPSLWFISGSPPPFPPESIKCQVDYAAGTSSLQIAVSNRTKTYMFVGAMRDSSLRTYIVHLEWDASNPRGTVQAKQKQIEPPRTPSKDMLEQYRRQYSDKLAKWCESKRGSKVGNGECWTLAHKGLCIIGAMPSVAYTHGAVLFSLPSLSPSFSTIARGDILQFDRARFVTGKSEVRAGNPRHTAIVTKNEGKGVVKTVEQNVGHTKKVLNGRYDLGTLAGGQVKVFRAVGTEWVGTMEAKW